LTNSRKTKRPAGQRKRPHAIVLSLVERGGNTRSITLDHRGVAKHLRRHVHKDSKLVSDKAQYYIHPPVAAHESVDHSKFEWARGDVHVHTNDAAISDHMSAEIEAEIRQILKGIERDMGMAPKKA
jgi:hypothetical protein